METFMYFHLDTLCCCVQALDDSVLIKAYVYLHRKSTQYQRLSGNRIKRQLSSPGHEKSRKQVSKLLKRAQEATTVGTEALPFPA